LSPRQPIFSNRVPKNVSFWAEETIRKKFIGRQRLQCTGSKEEELTTLSSRKLFGDIGRTVSLWEYSWIHNSFVDPYVVD
jgi:hypothetical protein